MEEWSPEGEVSRFLSNDAARPPLDDRPKIGLDIITKILDKEDWGKLPFQLEREVIAEQAS
jgi:hypothetical protein